MVGLTTGSVLLYLLLHVVGARWPAELWGTDQLHYYGWPVRCAWVLLSAALATASFRPGWRARLDTAITRGIARAASVRPLAWVAWAILAATPVLAYAVRVRQHGLGDSAKWMGQIARALPDDARQARIGNRSNFEKVQFRRRGRLTNLVVAECMEGEGRFLDAIVDGIWLTCEETYWGIPAHVGVQEAGSGLPDAAEPTVDLFAAETVALLAWILYLLGPELDRVSPLHVCRLSFCGLTAR